MTFVLIPFSNVSNHKIKNQPKTKCGTLFSMVYIYIRLWLCFGIFADCRTNFETSHTVEIIFSTIKIKKEFGYIFFAIDV